MYVAGEQVVAIGMTSGPREASGVIGLKAGLHPLRVDFAHGEGPPRLSVELSGSGRSRRELAAGQHVHATSGPADFNPPEPLSPTVFVPQKPDHLPRLLSETGIFRSLSDLSVQAGVIPYDVNSPLWSDGAEKRRWLIVPAGGRIEWAKDDPWRFAAGTAFVKHFELSDDNTPPQQRRRLETRLLVVNHDGLGYGVTYKWRADQTDAELLHDGLDEPIANGQHRATWSYPSRQQCLVCHTPQAGFVLGVNTRQLNAVAVTDRGRSTGESQLTMLARLNLVAKDASLGDAVALPKLAAISDESRPLELRVRSYLDSNCSQCHQPGGVRGEFDARYSTPLARQNLFDGKLVAADLGVPGTKLIVPGQPDRSMVLLRMLRREDVFNMPPLATHLVDQQAVDVLRRWIDGLGSAGPVPKQ